MSTQRGCRLILSPGTISKMQQPMMPGAEQKRIVQTGLTAIGPMHHVMRVQPFFMSAAGVATALVPRQGHKLIFKGVDTLRQADDFSFQVIQAAAGNA